MNDYFLGVITVLTIIGLLFFVYVVGHHDGAHRENELLCTRLDGAGYGIPECVKEAK